MNKLAIISDIHGNMSALEAVLADIDRKQIKHIVCLGDLVGYYCYYNEVVECIKNIGITCLMGNHDDALVNHSGIISRSKTCTRILSWQLQHAQPDTLAYLATLSPSTEMEWGGKSMLCVHGGLSDPVDEYLFDITPSYFSTHNFNADVLITGHTHLPVCRKFHDGKQWLNPGSVGQPRDGDNRASYLVVSEDWQINFIRVQYDYQHTVDRMKELGFDDYIIEPLITGKKIGLV